MDTQANTRIGPYTNFEELYTFKTCPTRLFLKLIGAKSEIERRYTPPSINPQLLGKIGEDRIKNNFMQERKVLVPEVKSKGIEFSLKGFERKFKQLKLSIENNEKILFSQIKIRVEINF